MAFTQPPNALPFSRPPFPTCNTCSFFALRLLHRHVSSGPRHPYHPPIPIVYPFLPRHQRSPGHHSAKMEALPTGDNTLNGSSWESVWRGGLRRGECFDKGGALPELEHALRDESLPTSGRVLVPGCGRGYDVAAFAGTGGYSEVVGVDISGTGVAAAREYVEGCGVAGPWRVEAGDFFAGAWDEAPDGTQGTFDVVYDYSFFCAIPVEWRGAWGRRMRQVVRRGGVLVTVMYPVGKARAEGGPPHGVAEGDYEEVLRAGFVKREARRVEDGRVHPGREGKTWWAVWERV